MVDKDKIRQKIHYIREQLKNLNEVKSLPPQDFLSSSLYINASLRELQVAIEAMIDICNHIVAREGWGILRSYQDGFRILTEHNVLEKEMLDIFIRMVKFRNRIVHLYDELKPEEVYRILQENLGDFERFVAFILEKYF
jgi:uncharacterized protein YutE (UPF0331/DUF86 family)